MLEKARLMSGKDIGTHFILYECERIYADGGMETEEPLGTEFLVLSSKNLAPYMITTGDTDIDIPEPDENKLVVLGFENLRFLQWDTELGMCHIEGVADGITAIKVLDVDA